LLALARATTLWGMPSSLKTIRRTGNRDRSDYPHLKKDGIFPSTSREVDVVFCGYSLIA
jgi:hypothetical protein